MIIMAPELLTAGFIVVIISLDLLINSKNRNFLGYVYIAMTAAVAGAVYFVNWDGSLFNGAYVSDGISQFSKIAILIASIATGLLSINTIKVKEKYIGAYYALLLSATLGMMLLVSSKELITLYVALETTTISLYGLTAIYKNDDLSLEAGIKYMILGAISSAILLYGISIIYFSTGTTYLQGILSKITGFEALTPYMALGMILILLGVGFKLSMVPMHVWTPDVYQGAPIPVTAFISVASKAAGFVFAIRLFEFTFIKYSYIWVPVMAVLAVLTMTIGNLMAIPQKNIKRLLAYSTISQAGYILVGFVSASETGVSSVLFYLLVYILTNIAAFAVVAAFSNAAGSDNLEDYAGLAQKEPLLAMAFLISLLSLAGIPPMAGFAGKFYLFYAAMQKGYTWLVVIAALNSTVSLYYYLLVIKQVYLFDRTKEIKKIIVPMGVKFTLAVLIVSIILLGIFPTAVIDWTISISQKLFM